MRLKRTIKCNICGNPFEANFFGRVTCNECKIIRSEQFLFRRIFIRLKRERPNYAREIENQMIEEDGLNFRDFAIAGFSTYSEFKKQDGGASA